MFAAASCFVGASLASKHSTKQKIKVYSISARFHKQHTGIVIFIVRVLL